MIQDQEDILPDGVELYDPDDFDRQRQLLYDSVLQGVQQSFPLSYSGVRVEVEDLGFDGPETYSRPEQRRALMENRTLDRKLRGTMRLLDDQTGEELDRRRTTLLRVPVLTERGTYIQNGSDIGSIRQGRLLAGPYSRRKANGQLETQFNVRVGTGTNFRVLMDPDSAQYRFAVKGSNLHLYSLLKDLGYEDEALARSWGDRILDINRSKYDKQTLGKAYAKLLPKYKQDPQASREQQAQAVRDALERVEVHERVLRKNLPNWADRVKAASWAEAGEAREQLAENARAVIKTGAMTRTQVLELVRFLNSEHQAGIVEGVKEEMEEAVVNFVRTRGVGINAAMAGAGQQGLAEVRRQNPELPRVEVAL
jgi:DNA-directed RNA polymerase beta subunit